MLKFLVLSIWINSFFSRIEDDSLDDEARRYADIAHHPLGKISKFANYVRILELRQAEAPLLASVTRYAEPNKMVTNSNLHYQIIKGIIEKGYAPTLDDLAYTLQASKEQIIIGLYELQDYHGVVLHPNEPKIWLIHPFSLAPTNFFVQTKNRQWWGNCAWCSLGIGALLNEDVKITTTIGAETRQIEINIVNGEVQEKNYFIHFPIPMKNAWDNVIYTCSNMLVFENEEQIDSWTTRHNIPKGDIQPIDKIWTFSKKWYGNHLNREWTKWSVEEAKRIFAEFDLQGKVWSLGDSKERF